MQLAKIYYYFGKPGRPSQTLRVRADEQYLEIITRGVGYLKQGGDDVAVPAGSILWHLPGQSTLGRPASADPFECLVVILQDENNELPPPPLPRLSLYGTQEETLQFAQRMLVDCQHANFDRTLMVESLIAHLRWRAHISDLDHHSALPLNLALCLEHIDRFFAHEITNPYLSTLSGLSASHLHALFRQHLQQSPHQIIIARRLQEVRLLLSSSNLSITDIAQRCGFGDTAHLSRVFKRAEGVTPTAYRGQWAHPWRVGSKDA